ncbi:MAG: Asp-tRNA(Asn)/Glu-tRNA(Gln) amidotransferase subunit GatA [Chloroflexota bacterium]
MLTPNLTINQASTMLRSGEVSSVELVQAFIDQIDQYEPSLHTFLHLEKDHALATARSADQLLNSGIDTAPLLGIPIGVKDNIHVQGMPTTCGSKMLEGYSPPFEATAISQLRQAGAIVVGKTNMDEFAMGSSTENSAYGGTYNPWNIDYVPGGSSGGSAAALASGFVLGALGSDTGGSVRQPASLCGVCGLKPSYGRISRYGLVAFGSSLDQIGLFARTAHDIALLLKAAEGKDPQDATSRSSAPIDFQPLSSLAGIRIGWLEDTLDSCTVSVKQAVQAALAEMENLGAELIPIRLECMDMALPAYYLIASAEASANLARFDGLRYGKRQADDTFTNATIRSRSRYLGPEVKRRIMLGTFALSAGYAERYYYKAQRLRERIAADFEEVFGRLDAIVSPTSPNTAFKVGAIVHDPIEMYRQDVFTLAVNLAGICGLSIPCGFDSLGLPIGVQLIGPQGRDELLLQVADTYQQATVWHLQRPDMALLSNHRKEETQ